MTAITRRTIDDVDWLELDVPGRPVNVIDGSVRSELKELIEQSASDSGVKAIVLVSRKPDNFMAGADVEEFAKLKTRAEALTLVEDGQNLINRFETIGKPIVAAIHGACLGGGLEAALACTTRIGTDHKATRFQFPEVRIGILPAAGGCQRLPRLVGLRSALEMILTGRTHSSKRAAKIRLIDDLVHPAILESVALETARKLIDGWRPKRPRFRPEMVAIDKNQFARKAVLARARTKTLEKTAGNYPAPLAAIDAIGHGLQYGIEAGLAHEAAAFSELAINDGSKNLVRLFFDGTALKKAYGPSDGYPEPRKTSNVGVVGSGFMGSAIAGVVAARAVAEARLRDISVDRLVSGLDAARSIVDSRQEKGALSKHESRYRTFLVSGGVDWAGFGRADLVIEAATEDLETKRAIIPEIESNTKAECVIASNTSTLLIRDIADAATEPHRFLGMHFFSPVEKMNLVEVVPHENTERWVISAAAGFVRSLGKTAVVVADSPGFWVNRILAPYLREAWILLESGADPLELDKEMIEFGFPVGPVTLLDEVGLDVVLESSHALGEAYGERMSPRASLSRLVGDGRLGRKSGRGLFEYRKDKKKRIDKSSMELICDQDSPPPNRTSERLVYAMLNEAAAAFAEGVVGSARDGDMGAILGFGFPPFRGGPLRYIDRIGLSEVIKTLKELSEEFGQRFEPVTNLKQMAELDTKFHQQQL